MLADPIHSERLTLRCLEESDVTARYLSWMMDPEVNRYLESRYSTPTLDELKDYVAQMRASEHSYFFGIFTAEDGEHRGNIKIGPINAEHGNAAIGIILGDKAVWGRGIATEAIGALSDWGFRELGLAKIYAGAYAANHGSVSAFERNGFAIEGVQRSHVLLASGERGDLVLLGKVRY